MLARREFSNGPGNPISGRKVVDPLSSPPPAFTAANEICAHYFLQASGGCRGGHVSVNLGTEVEPHQRRRLMLSDLLS